jgi:flagellar hook-associated protein 3 FlgL
MRVSTSMMYDRLTDQMTVNSDEMSRLQSALSTGQKFARPSDAPELVGRVQAYESRLKTLEADKAAVQSVQIGVDAQSKALQQSSALFDRLKELAFQAAQDPISQAQLDSIAAEVGGIKRSLVDLANTRDASDRYVFGGINSGVPPYVIQPDGKVEYEGSTTPLRVRVADVSYEDATVSGPSVWQGIERGGKTVSMFDILGDFEQALRENNLSNRTQGLRDVEELLTKVGTAIARTGGIQQRLDIAMQQADETTVRAQQTLSDLKDLDYSTALSKLQQQEILMQASQSLLARMSKLTLLNQMS